MVKTEKKTVGNEKELEFLAKNRRVGPIILLLEHSDSLAIGLSLGRLLWKNGLQKTNNGL